MNIGIKAERLRKGMSQKELAKIVGVDQVSVHHWETGVCNPRTDRLQKIANALECSLDALLTTTQNDEEEE